MVHSLTSIQWFLSMKSKELVQELKLNRLESQLMCLLKYKELQLAFKPQGFQH